MTEAWTATPADAPDERSVGDDISYDHDGSVGDDISNDHEAAGEESQDDAGIPDEPETFVEELRAVADLPETGDPRVDEVLSGLAGLENIPTADHVAVYDQVHRGLQDALANLDQG